MNYEKQGGLKKVVSKPLTIPSLPSSEMSAAPIRPPSKLKLAFQPGEAVTEERLAAKLDEMKIFMEEMVQRAVVSARGGQR